MYTIDTKGGGQFNLNQDQWNHYQNLLNRGRTGRANTFATNHGTYVPLNNGAGSGVPAGGGGIPGAGAGSGNPVATQPGAPTAPPTNINPDDFFNTPPGLQDFFSRLNGMIQPIGQDSRFQELMDAANGGTLNNFNKAADRVRQRLNTEGNSQRRTLVDRGAATGNFGSLQNQLNQSRGAELNAFGNELVNLENQFEGQRQTGLQTALSALQAETDRDLGFNQQNIGLIKDQMDALLKAAGIKSGQFSDLIGILFGQEPTIDIDV